MRFIVGKASEETNDVKGPGHLKPTAQNFYLLHIFAVWKLHDNKKYHACSKKTLVKYFNL